jgi:hypothetical protein
MLGEEKELCMDGFYEKPLKMQEEDELDNDACVEPFFFIASEAQSSHQWH